MPKRKPKTLRLSKRHLALTLVTLFVGGLVIGCAALAYIFVAFPALHARGPAVAGTDIERWVAPVHIAGAPAEPAVIAPYGLLVDVETGTILWERASAVPRPLASLTKLVTTGAYMATHPNLEQTFLVPASFNTSGIANVVEPGDSVSRLNVQAGERLTQHNLLFASLISSANNAAIALARSASVTVDQLQQFAETHGATTARIVEPSGLSPINVGSAQDVAVLANVAFTNPVIRQAAGLAAYRITTGAGRLLTIRSTNQLIGRDGYRVVAGKTGYLVEAGYNLAVLAESNGREVLLVLLGAPTAEDRFADADALLTWVYDAFAWQEQQGGAILPL